MGITKRAIEYKHSNVPTATPVVVDSTVGGVAIVAENKLRQSVTLQNVGTVACLIRIGGAPSATAYNFVLSADSLAKAGQGGLITLTGYQGSIVGITESSSTTIAIYEEVSSV